MYKSSRMTAIITGLFILVIIAHTVAYQLSRAHISATVVKTERVCTSSIDCKYLIFTDVEVFENSDSLLNLKFDSSDFYAKIVNGKTYEFHVIGWRIPAFSSYRNVLAFTEK